MALQLPAPYPLLAMERKRKAYNRSETVPGTFGHWLRRVREDELHLTQSEFAALVGDNMDPSDVSQLERGRVGLPEPPRMIALARALDMPVPALYAEAGFPEFVEGLPSQFFRELKLSVEARARRKKRDAQEPA